MVRTFNWCVVWCRVVSLLHGVVCEGARVGGDASPLVWVVVFSRSLRVGSGAAFSFGLVLLFPCLRLRRCAFLSTPFWVVVVSRFLLCMVVPFFRFFVKKGILELRNATELKNFQKNNTKLKVK